MLPVDFPWRAVFDRSPVAMSLIDVHGRQLSGNAAYAELLGVPLDEIERLDVGSISRPEDRDFTAGYLTRLVSGDVDEFSTVKHYVRRDGTSVPAQLRASAIRDADGNCVALLGVIAPIEAPDRVDDLRLRRVLEFAQATFTVVDANGEVLETSGRYQSVLGYPADFWEQRTIFDLLMPDSVEPAIAFRDLVLASPGTPLSIEIDVRAADGSRSTLLVHAVNLLDDKHVAGVVLTSQNVTEQRSLVAELAARREMAEGVAEARTNLLATVSHELRNPLHAVQGLAELLAAEPLPSRAAGLAATLARQLEGLANVTQDLLDTARLDAGSVELVVRPCELRTLVDEVVEFARAAAGDQSIVIGATVDNGVPTWVAADRQRLRQILRNLVINAVKFTPTGTVSLDIRKTSDGVLFRVVDTGVGIPDDEIERVLQPFRSASTAGTGRGAGLGLAIVHRLVAAMGGSLQVTSRVGEGSTFEIDLPLAASDAPGAHAPSRGTDGATVLVVEDNLVNQRLAQSQLDHLSMTAIIVGSGEAALELMGSSDAPIVDVTLMDQQLPGIDGVETTRQLRKLRPEVAAIPVIGLTASASAADRTTFLAAGMDGFIAKPATLADIRTAITDALNGRRTVRIPPAPTTTVSTAEEGLKVLDLEVLDQLEIEFGDSRIVTDLIDAFLGELPARGRSVVTALADGDYEGAKRAAHTLKSSALLLGAMRLGDLCKAIEHDGVGQASAMVDLLASTDHAVAEWRARRACATESGG